MEVRRLLTALKLVKGDFDYLEIQKELSALQSAASSLAATPSDAAISQQFTMALDTLQENLEQADSNTATASIRTALKEVRLDSLIGANLLSSVNEIFDAK